MMTKIYRQRLITFIIVFFVLIINILFHSIDIALADNTIRVSVDSIGGEADNISRKPSISADGRFIAFESLAGNLVLGDTNGYNDIFVYDRQTGLTKRVSINDFGEEANNNSYRPSISADGNLIAFESLATNLVINDTNSASDIFVHNIKTGSTRRLSVNINGTQGNGNNYEAAISGNGRYVAFWSYATNLVSNDTNGWVDVFIQDIVFLDIKIASVTSNGIQGNNSSYTPSLSFNGQYVAFESNASNLISLDSNKAMDIFLHDRISGQTTLISSNSSNTQGNSNSYDPSISDDGLYVAFQSYSTNLVTTDTNNKADIFTKNVQTGLTSRASVSSAGTEGNNLSSRPSINADGNFVVFESVASNLVGKDTNNNPDIFVHDNQTGTTSIVSVSHIGALGNNSSNNPSVTSDGRYVAFDSWSTNLVDGDTNNLSDVFLRHPEPDPSALNIGVTGADDRNSDIAYNSQDNQFLTVWKSDGRIMGEIRLNDGSILKDDFLILKPELGISLEEPAVTYWPAYNIYIIVAREFGGAIANRLVAIRLSNTGNVLGSLINVVPTSLNAFYNNPISRPDIKAPDHFNSCCSLVVWERIGRIEGQFIHGDGTLEGTNFVITADISKTLLGPPKITNRVIPGTLGLGHDEFLVTYKVKPELTSSYISNKILSIYNGNGSISGESIVSYTGVEASDPDVSYNPISERYLVVWEDGSIKGQLLNINGGNTGGNFDIKIPSCSPPPLVICGDAGDPAVVSMNNSNNFMVTYWQKPPILFTDSDISGILVDSNAQVGSQFVIFSDSGLNDLNPVIAHNPQSRNFMFSWDHEVEIGNTFYDVYGQVLPDFKTLTITKSGTGDGTITSNPAGINCGTDCSGAYNEGSAVTLTATPDNNSLFDSWGGDPDCTDGIVTMFADKNCIAIFYSSDTTPPTGSILINSGASITSTTSVILNLSCLDPGSGCSQMRFSNDVINWSLWESYAISKSWGLTIGDGLKTVFVQYKDTIGNISNIYSDSITLQTNLPSVSLTLSPVSTSIPRGGKLEYTVTVTNNTTSSQTFQYWTYVTLPNNSRWPATGELYGPNTITLPAGQSRNSTIYHSIPLKAPVGTYTYYGQVGLYPKGVWNTDSFNFNVTLGP